MSQLPTDAQVEAEREFDDMLRRASGDHRRSQINGIGRDGVTWLALAPSWTTRLAKEAGFPFRGTIERFVKSAEDARLCVTEPARQTPVAGDPELHILASLGADLPRGLAGRALELVANADERTRSIALSDLAPALGPEHASQAVRLALSIADPADRATALAALASAGSVADAAGVRAAALAVAKETQSARVHVELAAAAPELMSEALRLLAEPDGPGVLGGPAERAQLLARLAPLLPVSEHGTYLAVVRELSDPRAQVELALALAPSIAEDELRRTLVGAAVEWAAQIDDPAGRSAARAALTRALIHAGDQEAAESQARRIEELDTRALAYGELAGAAAAAGDGGRAESLLASARLSLESTVTGWQQVGVLASVAQALLTAGDPAGASGICDEALAASAAARETLRDTAEAFRPLVTLAAVLRRLDRDGDEPARRAYAIAQRLGGARERAEPLLQVAPLLPEALSREAIARAVEALHEIADPLERVPLLPRCLRQLPLDAGLALIEDTLSETSSSETDTAFWMPEPARVEILDALTAPDEPKVDLVGVTGKIGVAIERARDGGVPVPAPLLRWSGLARTIGTEDVAATSGQFLKEYSDALDVGDVSAALDWIQTGAALADTLGDESLASVVRYARRRMEIVHRELQERRSPEPFLERPDQLAAFAELRAAGDEEAWALHYLGLGGVGKSTLIRHLARQDDFITAKVDFDYLSPDYPVRKPAQLLLELMAELELHAPRGRRAESLIQSFRDTVIKLHEDSQETESKDPEQQLRQPQFGDALASFCDVLRLLDREVVLILDTCEELARFAREGERAANVVAAFGAIERIHAQFPAVRVVFAGRRLLARSGAGWEAVSGPALAQDPRPYLRLHVIQGFDPDEAEDFFTVVKKLEIEPDLRGAVLKRSPQPEFGVQWTWTTPRPQLDSDRYNPFDLAIYAAWIAEEGDVSAADIESNVADPYVDLRIVGRISPDRMPGLRELLPAVALLRRFDRELLRPVFQGSDAEFNRIFAELGTQEWLGRIEGVDNAPSELVVDANLRPRLLKYYRDESRLYDTEEMQEALAERVAERLDSAPLGRISPEHLEAAVDILEERDVAAAWHRLVHKLAAEQRWDWAGRGSRRLLADEGVLEATHPAFAAVTATLVAVYVHEDVETGREGIWRTVLEAADADPDPAASEWLKARAHAGLIVAGDLGHVPALLEVLSRFPGTERAADLQLRQHRCEQLAASCCSALEALPEPLPDADAIGAWADGLGVLEVSGEVRAAAHTAAAHSLAAAGRVEDALKRLLLAERCTARQVMPTERWLDWGPPASPYDRVRLEVMRLGGTPADEMGDEALARIETIDGERLVSAVLSWRLARGLVSDSVLTRFEEPNEWDPSRRPVCEAHHATRPLFCTVALGWLALGQARRALDVLSQHKAAAFESAEDPATVHAAELATLEVLRRMRMRGEETVPMNEYTGMSGPVEWDAALAVIALTRGPDEQPDDLPWRFCEGLSWAGHEQLVTAGSERWGPGAPEPERPNERLDREEYRVLTGARRDADLVSEALERLTARPTGEPELRLALRALALQHDVEAPRAVDLPAEVVSRAGPRRVAELALEEGELLALRLPPQAQTLLRLARDEFVETHDHLGVLLATIRLALAHAHANDDAVDRAELDRNLRSAFSAAVEARSFPPAPGVDALQEDPFDVGSFPPWSGWQRRLGLALRFGAGEAAPPRTGTAAPPVELDLNPWGEKPASTPWPQTMLLAIFGLALIAVAVAGAAWLLQWSLGLAAVGVSLLAAVGLLAAVAVCLWLVRAALRSIGRDVRSAAATRAAMRLSVSGAVETVTVAWPPPRRVLIRLGVRRAPSLKAKSPVKFLFEVYAEFWTSLRTAATPRPWRLSETREVEARWDTPPPGPYKAAKPLPGEIAAAIASVLEDGRPAPLPLALDVPAPLAGLPWEAFVLGAGKPQPFRHEPWREPDDQRQARTRPAGRVPVAVLSSREWRRLATDGWSDWRGSVILENEVAGLEPFVELRVVHAIGRPVAGTTERLLQLGGGDRSSGTLLRPGDLAARRASLVILQAEPAETGEERFSTEREDAARLKLVASDVFAAGAGAVLTLPVIPPSLAPEVLRQISRRLRPRARFSPAGATAALVRLLERRLGMRSDPELGRLLALVGELRERIGNEQSLADAAELAADVCLFARSDADEFATETSR